MLAILIIRGLDFSRLAILGDELDPYYKFGSALYFSQISISSFDSTISANRSIRLSTALCPASV